MLFTTERIGFAPVIMEENFGDEIALEKIREIFGDSFVESRKVQGNREPSSKLCMMLSAQS